MLAVTSSNRIAEGGHRDPSGTSLGHFLINEVGTTKSGPSRKYIWVVKPANGLNEKLVSNTCSFRALCISYRSLTMYRVFYHLLPPW